MAGCFPDKTGYAVGSVEGRCSIAYIEDTSKNFAFKWLGKAEVRLGESPDYLGRWDNPLLSNKGTGTTLSLD